MVKSVKIAFDIALASLLLGGAFVWGVATSSLEVFPYRYLSDQIAASKALVGLLRINEKSKDIRWPKENLEPRGLIDVDPVLSEPGYTLFTSTHDSTARLLDHSGRVVHAWKVEFNKIWDNQDHVLSLKTLSDSYFYLRDFYLYPNGEIVLALHVAGVTPWGVGLVKLDQASNTIWHYSGYVNNDFEVAQSGNIFAVIHKIREEPIEKVESIMPPFLEDHIATLDSNGNELATLSLITALEKSDYADLLYQLEYMHQENSDTFHTNSIEEVLSDDPGVPWLKRGNLLLSIRNLNALAVLNPKTEQIVYATGLRTRMQHDIDLLPTGNLMLYDNRGSLRNGGQSRVIEFDPLTQAIVWKFEGTPEDPLHTEFWGAQQRLTNGNTLIVDPERGRIIEVTQDGKMVWDYRTPLVFEREGVDHVPSITHAERIPLDYIQFDLAGPE